ncbi:ATP-binding protein [Winogradskyella sp. A2]|uniref:ATP-binding protein n=1 Tax=Winogradskyella sp. A2 TaxID=3366944 RepID=UPI00398C50FE
MKLTTKLINELDQWLDNYWKIYLKGDLKTWSQYLSDDYYNIGGTKEEIWRNKQEILDYTYTILDQLLGKVELRNRNIDVITFEKHVMVNEFLDMYIKNNKDWEFYGHFRLSSFIEKTDDSWLVLHQHGSFPDMKAAEGEAFGLDALKAENERLQKAVSERTLQLEHNNRELQIEASLQRIRAEAVAMKASSDLLDIVVTMRNEFIKLGHEAHYFWHMMWLPETYEKAMTSGDGSKIGFVMTLPRHIHGDIPLLAKWEKSNKPTVVYTFTTEESIDYVDKMVALGDFKSIDPQAPSHDDLKHIGGLTFIMARTTHGEIGYSLPGIVKNPPKEDLDILVRFAGAFDLAHKRFLDLQKTEAQARETQIELAIEKVRSRTMAMQHSDELQETSFLLDQQVRALGIETWGCAFHIYGENESTEWFGNEKGVLPTYTVPRTGIFKKYFEKGKKGETLFVQEFSGKVCVAHYEYMSTLPVIGDVLLKLKETNNGFPTYQIDHVVYFKYGYLLFITKEQVPDAHDIFRRFTKVFEQTYTRFLDLKKAEAQAREAQVEAALERVRSASMAMHKTEDLSEVVLVYFQQLKQLNIEFVQSWITIFHLDEGYVDVWFSPLEGLYDTPTHFKMPSALFEETSIKSWKEGNSFSSISFETKEQVNQFFQVCDDVTSSTYFGDTQKKLQLEQFEMLDANHKYGCISKSSTHKATEEEKTILKRFARVFDQTYTRFLDLQKAETQTREAQINLAVERVRAKALAMHKSEEIMEVVAKLKEEVMALDIPDVIAATIFLSEGDDKVRMWDLSSLEKIDGVYQSPLDITFKLKKTDPHLYPKRVWENPDNYFVEIQDANGFKRILAWLREHGEHDVANETEAFIETTQLKQLYHVAKKLNNGKLVIDLLNPPSDEMEAILTKMGAAFDLAYKRFEDLQKAEAQAREAQIETALERIRSQSMGMQSSGDFGKVTTEMFNQLRSFGEELFATGIVFCDKHEGHVEQWHSIPGGGMLSPMIVPVGLDYIHQYRYDQWKAKKELFSIEIPSDFIKQHFEDIFKLPSAQITLKDLESRNAPMPEPPPWEIDYGASFKNGYILVSSLKHLENTDLLPRFAKVFEQTYTRFLDLQKAEAQAREAQIETALEKVRSQSLAMHKPDELQEVVAVVAEKLKELGVIYDAGGVILCTYFPYNKDVVHWIAVDDFSTSGRYFMPYFDNPIFNDAWDSKIKGDAYFSKEFPVEAKNEFFKHAFENSDYKNMPEDYKEYVLKADTHALSAAWSKNSAIIIPSLSGVVPSESDADILKRFAKVFEQAYIRFMDLEKAEAQTREAQIETALEKVRSRTMAMQHSDELPEAANNLFLQVQELGIPAWSAGYCIWEDKTKKSSWCNMSSEGEIQKGFSLPTIGEGYNFYDPMIKGEPFYVAELGGNALVKHYDFMRTLPIVGEIFDDFAKKGIDLPTFQIFHIVYFEYGFVMFITYEAVPDAHDIFTRFGKVFEQTYTRFLDLQTKETQATKLAEEKERLEHTLDNLRTTQKQLIQSEKMASLGELTAGIAHEIQNPLNFVNNFSDVSKELLEEMIEELEKGDMEEVKAIMDDVVQNLDKINHHGQRADSIVKGMLQHSRASGDKKEPTDINALADEYLRLAYHGLRAKDKSFNAELVTDFDDSIQNINIIPQDVGRVILNLLTNAFYVVNEKKKTGIEGYKPTVSISTKRIKDFVEISVEDNGNGMPESVKEKIFQPFFTTKPTGEGTGLGLSLSYDIITKGHGGKLKVKSDQGKGTIFKIELPI